MFKYYIKEVVLCEIGKSGVTIINGPSNNMVSVNKNNVLNTLEVLGFYMGDEDDHEEWYVSDSYEDGDLVKFVVEEDSLESRFVAIFFKCGG